MSPSKLELYIIEEELRQIVKKAENWEWFKRENRQNVSR